MKFRSSLPVVFFLFVPVLCEAQVLNDKSVMTVAGREVPAGEFIRMYNKSIGVESKPDVDGYLQQYITFKLKVADAVSQGLDTTKSFRNELNGYRNQLAQNYLTDTEKKEQLLRKTYKRSLTEINAWHILINCPEGAKPADTLEAWQKAAGIRERIVNGEPFEQVARGASDDPSVKINGGNLGYFTIFQMIMPFEDAAYDLNKGGISNPVRTPYGYHIIRVADKKPARGKVLVAHIMKACPPGTDETEARLVEESINNIYRELESGASFSVLASKYSDHKESAVTGGKLNWFGAGEIITEFAEAALSIADTGKYTKPVRTPYGWHIIKLLDKKPHGFYDELKSFLESRINQSYLNSLSRRSLVERLKNEYKFRINQTAYGWFVSNTDTLVIMGLTKYNRTGMPSGYLYTYANQKLSTREFASYIEKRGSRIITKDPVDFIDKSIESMVSDQIINYENSVLEKKYPDFRYLMNEFHDGILLFEVSSRKVWNRVQEDSAGLIRYYEDHKQNFLSRKGIEAKIYSLRSVNGVNKLASAYRKYSRKADCDKLMLSKFNRKIDSLLFITEGTWFTGDDPEIDRVQWIKSAQTAKIKGNPSLVVINRIIEPAPLPLEEVRGEMMSGYQEYLENEWIAQLKEKYSVRIDNAVLAEVKKSLKDE